MGDESRRRDHSGGRPGTTPPEAPREAAFSIIGLQVGLTFTFPAVRRIGRLLPQLFVYVVAIPLACELLAWALSGLTNISLLNANLATTPGGINAILVTAFAAGANTALVFAVQTIRLFAMVLIAPPLIAWLVRTTAHPPRTRWSDDSTPWSGRPGRHRRPARRSGIRSSSGRS